VDPPPLDLEARPVRPGRIVSPLRVRGLGPAEGGAEQMLGKIAGRVVGTAHDAARPQLIAYMGMEREEFGGGQLGKVRQQVFPGAACCRPGYTSPMMHKTATIDIAPTPFLERVLSLSLKWDLMLDGGRGGGKTYAVIIEVFHRAELWGAQSRTLITRWPQGALSKLEQSSHAMQEISKMGSEPTLTARPMNGDFRQ